nr:cytochrome b/b6 domain-containing protein [uncultured Rhodopila sp.]
MPPWQETPSGALSPPVRDGRAMNTASDAPHYGRPTIALHWISVVLVAALWLGPEAGAGLAPPWLRGELHALHILLGGLLGCVLIVRVAVRGRDLIGRRGRRSDLPAEAMHAALYLVLAATIALGLVSLWAQGVTLSHVPATPANPALSRALIGLHGLGANLVLILAAVHLVAALAHHCLWRDGLLYRMHPLRRRQR